MLNKMILQGRLVSDPELKQSVGGVNYAKFTVAWSQKKGESKDELFLDCMAWRNTADMVVKYFKKGKQIIVEGSVSQNLYKGDDGIQRKTYHMDVQSVNFCGDSSTEAAPQEQAAPHVVDNFKPLNKDEGLPF